MDEAGLREVIRDGLRRLTDTLEAALRAQLAQPIDLEDGGVLLFEIEPSYYDIRVVQTSAELLPEYAVWDAVPEAIRRDAADADVDVADAFEAEVTPWLADRWAAVDGPRQYPRAYAYYHGGPSQPLYDLDRRRWLAVKEVWPDGA